MNRHLKSFCLGTAYGLAMRLLFGSADTLGGLSKTAASGPMLAAFVIGVPILVGGITVYTADPKELTWLRAIFRPWLPTLAFVAGTALLLIEGSICIAMALPIFLFAASVGGVLAFLVRRTLRPAPGAVSALLALPLVLGYAETQLPLPQDTFEAKDSVLIAAPPEAIWQLINGATGIQPEEMRGGLAWAIGVPYPVEAITHTTGDQRVRKLRWQKDVSFDEPITAWEENRFIQWRYDFKPDSFPPGALDDHVLIGGKYFDLIDTSYKLTPEGAGTRLEIVVNYRVSTHFNFYATAWARVLVDDAASAILGFYKHRSERPLAKGTT
jgi:hypothetical protein